MPSPNFTTRSWLGAVLSLSLTLVAIVAPAGWPHVAHAWGDEGHKIICAIANNLLNSEQRKEVQRLIDLYRPGAGSPYRFFTTACTFADLARIRSRDFVRARAQGNRARKADLEAWARFAKFDNWHFLNVSRAAQVASPAACRDDCILKAISEHQSILANKQLKDWQRAEALILLGHWVGDIHQPLHVSYEDDRGGSAINRIKGGFYTNPDFHSVWDSGIIKKARGGDDWRKYGNALMTIAASDRRTWEQTRPLEWANESYRIAIAHDTDYCELAGGECKWEGKTRTLTSAYQARFQPVVEMRLRQAGVRLAKLIADALE